MSDVELNAITEKSIGCSSTVSNALGCGFLEVVYQNALVHELRKAGLRADAGQRVSVVYDGIVVGEFVPDILVEGAVIDELKAVREHNDLFTAQCLNYLKATGLQLCLLLNFGTPRVDVKRYRRSSCLMRPRMHDLASIRVPPCSSRGWANDLVLIRVNPCSSVALC